MVGAWERGGVQQAADQQQQQTWGQRRVNSFQRLTTQQQQHQPQQRQWQQQPSSTQQCASLSAGQAFDLYRAYVAAGQWAKLTVELRQVNTSHFCAGPWQQQQQQQLQQLVGSRSEGGNPT